MVIAEKEVTLKNGQAVILRSPQVSDAEGLLEHLQKASEETYFLSRYPEEITFTREEEADFIRMIAGDKENFMIAAFLEGELIGSASLQRIQDLTKCSHRASFGISIRKKLCGLGLGTRMMEEVLQAAKYTRFEQIELGVLSDNWRAMHLYEKLGFVRTGILPRAFKLKDGSYCDEILMVYLLEDENKQA